MRYPWLNKQWQQLQSQKAGGKLPHALLFAGPAGLGKYEFAIDFAKSILCGNPQDNGAACGHCRSCIKFAADTHPDSYLITPEETGKQIKIDQIRELITQFSLASHQGGYRATIISPAENMTLAASNSLLKTLEEPPANTLLMLVTARPNSLPATILSRCQRLKFAAPDRTQAYDWLKNTQNLSDPDVTSALAVANNSPLKAISYLDNEQPGLRNELFSSFCEVLKGKSALQVIKPWLKPALAEPINWVYSWVCDLIRIKSGFESCLVNEDLSMDLHNLAQLVDLEGLFGFQDELVVALRSQRAAFNVQLQYESLLLDWGTLNHKATG